jgi:serine/threonine kinase PknH
MSSPLVANPVDAATLADELARYKVVDSSRLTELMAEFPGGEAPALAEYLVRRGALSPFQAERALAGGARWLNLGPYRLIGEANHGTFGPVYVAVHRDRPGAEFRLRMFPLRSLWRARQAKQIARALAAPPHPVIVPLADADSANGLHYLVWPHAEGTPLADRVTATNPLPVNEVVGLLIHLSNALHSCHLLKVAHGTITPQSVVLGSDGLPQLLEHGAGAILAENLATGESLLDTLSATVAMENVLEYAAPEFIASPGAPTAAADQYALGAVAYFALTSHSPYPDGSRTEQLSAKLTRSPRPIAEMNPAVPSILAAVIDRMLSPVPGERYSTLADVRNHLAALDSSWPTPPAAVPPSADTLLLTPTSARRVRAERNPEPLKAVPPSSHADETPGQAACGTRPERPLPVPPPLPDPSPASSSPSRPALPRTEDPAMAKLAQPEPAGAGDVPKPKKRDPRTSVGSPIYYHTETPPDPSSGFQPGLPEEPPAPGEPPLTDSVLWKKLKRSVLFWRASQEVVQVSVFGPPSLAPGQPGKVSVYLHTPETSDSVNTLCRAFHHDAVLIGTGFISREVVREEELGVHFSVANAGVSKSLQTFHWRGQPHRIVFDLHVPWESPGGPAPGVVSIGSENVRIGRIEFRLLLTPRKS